MVAAAVASAAPSLTATRKTVASRKAFSGSAVPLVNRRIVARVNKAVVASAEKKQTLELPAAMTVALGTALASPLAAQAGVTPSLKNLINSVIAGGVVLGLIFGAVTLVAGFDPVKRG